MFTTKEEEIFFFNSINNNSKVLEYGSGISTLQIADKCRYIISIEHQKEWYDKNINNIPNNCELLLKRPDIHYIEGFHCGTYDEFKTYIESPINKGPFDVILIDGRARISCASICHKMSHKDTLIFVHDFHREEYKEIMNFLSLIEVVGTMAKFKI